MTRSAIQRPGPMVACSGETVIYETLIGNFEAAETMSQMAACARAAMHNHCPIVLPLNCSPDSEYYVTIIDSHPAIVEIEAGSTTVTIAVRLPRIAAEEGRDVLGRITALAASLAKQANVGVLDYGELPF